MEFIAITIVTVVNIVLMSKTVVGQFIITPAKVVVVIVDILVVNRSNKVSLS